MKILLFILIPFFLFAQTDWSDETVNYPDSLDNTTSLFRAQSGEVISSSSFNKVLRSLYLMQEKMGVLGSDSLLSGSEIKSDIGDTATVLRSDISDSIATWSDTTSMKASTSVKGYLKQLSSANSGGYGWFTTIDSAHASDEYFIFDHPTAGKQWKRINNSQRHDVDVMQYITGGSGSRSDPFISTDKTAGIQTALSAQNYIYNTYDWQPMNIILPAGYIRFDTTLIVKQPINLIGAGTEMLKGPNGRLQNGTIIKSNVPANYPVIEIRGDTTTEVQTTFFQGGNFRDFSIAGNRGEDCGILFTADNILNFRIERVNIDSVGNDGIHISDTTTIFQSQFEKLSINKSERDGIYFSGINYNSGDGGIGCAFRDIKSQSNGRYGMHIYKARTITFDNLVLDVAEDAGLFINYGAYLDFSDVNAEDADSANVWLKNTSRCSFYDLWTHGAEGTGNGVRLDTSKQNLFIKAAFANNEGADILFSDAISFGNHFTYSIFTETKTITDNGSNNTFSYDLWDVDRDENYWRVPTFNSDYYRHNGAVAFGTDTVLNTFRPRHDVSIYDSNPTFGMTDTDGNKKIGNAAQVQDTSAFWLDIVSGHPQINMVETNGDGYVFKAISGTNVMSIIKTGVDTVKLGYIRGTSSFTTTSTADTVLVSGASATDFYSLTPTGTAVDTLDVLMSVPKSDTLIVIRPAGGTSGLTYDWIKFK